MFLFRGTFLIAIIVCWLNNLCKAQAGFIQISGMVTDSSNHLPLDHASVYLSNTTIGTTTSADGTFSLTNIPPGRYDLIISYIGFKTQVLKIDERSNNRAFKIQLQQDVTKLEGVIVKAGKFNKSYLKKFKKYFIGTDENASNCTISNPEVLLFDLNKQTGLFTANTKKVLVSCQQ